MSLELQGYFARSNVRFKVASVTPTGRTAAYSDLDIVAVKCAPDTGQVTDRLWGEIKAHLTLALTPGYVRGFPDDYATMLDLTKIASDHESLPKWRARQEAAKAEATRLLGPGFRRVLFFGGKIPADRGLAVRDMLDRDVEIVFIRDLAPTLLSSLGHQEGNEPLVRVINLLDEYGLLSRGKAAPMASRLSSSPKKD